MVFFRIHRHYKETAAKLRLDQAPIFQNPPVKFDPAVHKELAIYFCDTWSQIAVAIVEAVLRRGLPMLIIHIGIDPKRTEAFTKRCQEIVDLNGWDMSMIQVIEDPYRDLYKSVAEILQQLRAIYPEVYFEVYIGALRTTFPYSLLHMSTDKFLRDAMMEVDNVALNVKQINLDALKLPPGFKVTFEHATDHHLEEHEAVPQT
jgi:hypothetical protein